MGLRLVRETSTTPNITNKDDSVMIRYAYGGYNGVVKAFGSECGYTAENGIFKVLDGRIVVDGWEIDVDGAGWFLDLSTSIGTQYQSIYAEINVVAETVKLDSTYLQGTYPEIAKGDDLTAIPNGTARLLLYNVKVENGLITEVVKRFNIIQYTKDLIDGLKNGSITVGNANKVNGFEVKNNDKGVLTVGDIILPQKKLIWNNGLSITPITLSIIEQNFYGKTLEICYKVDDCQYYQKIKVPSSSEGKTTTITLLSARGSSNLYAGSNTPIYVYVSVSDEGWLKFDMGNQTTGQFYIEEIYEIIE